MDPKQEPARRRLLIVTDCSHGGTFQVATMLAEGLREDFEPTFATPVDDATPRHAETLRRLGVAFLPSALSYENLERATFDQAEATRLLDASRPDMIVCCDGAELSSLLAVKAVARRRGIPYLVIVNLLSEDLRERFAPFLTESKRALEGAAAVAFVSLANRARFERLFPDVAGRREVVPNSASDVFFAPCDEAKRRELRAALGIADDEMLCLTAARIEQRKGQAVVAAALGRLRADGKGSTIRWALAGRVEDWDRKHFEAALDEAGVADRVTILGERGDVPSLMDAADVFILTSYAEGMPLCVVEALAKGVPVVATAIDGIVEQLDESCGILLPAPAGNEPACIAACAAALDRLARDHALLARMGEAAAARARLVFHPSIGVARYRALLADAAGTSVGSREPQDEPDFSVRPGTSLDFGRPEVAWNYLDEGWATCETGGAWTVGLFSTIRLDLGDAGTPLRLDFDVTPFAKRRSRVTRVSANGVRLVTWRTVAWHRIVSVVVDPRVTGPHLLLRLDNPGATRPCDVGAGSDWRQLGLFVHRLEVSAASPSLREAVGRRWRAWRSAPTG